MELHECLAVAAAVRSDGALLLDPATRLLPRREAEAGAVVVEAHAAPRHHVATQPAIARGLRLRDEKLCGLRRPQLVQEARPRRAEARAQIAGQRVAEEVAVDRSVLVRPAKGFRGTGGDAWGCLKP